MESFDSGQKPPPQFPTHSAGSAAAAVFDASQYAFFGNYVVHEVELGGLEDDDHDDNHDHSLLNEIEAGFAQSMSDVNDLASSLSKINSKFNDFSEIGVPVDAVASNENPYIPQWKQGDSTRRPAQQTFDSESPLNGNVLSSELLSSYAHSADSQSLYRTSYPQQQPFKYEIISSDPLLVTESSLTTYTPPGLREQFLPNFHEHHLNMLYRPQTAAGLTPNSICNTQYQVPRLNHASQFDGKSSPLVFNIHMVPSQGENQAAHFSAKNASLVQQPPSQNGTMNPLYLHQEYNQEQIQQSRHLSKLQVSLRNSDASSAQFMMRNFDHMLASADWGDQPHELVQKGRQNLPSAQRIYESVGHRNGSWWPVFKSKCMTTDELDNILRMQLAATHSDDPYMDDYYHQASLAKKAAGKRFKHRFCPAYLRNIPPGARANSEPHAFLKIEALGRVPFSSIHRPRPILEVDSPISLSSSCIEPQINENPLQQDSMLVARAAIEDGMCLLLDVNDIDRFLQFNQLQDGGAHLKKRRQTLLERVAMLLQLVDPLGKNCQTGRFSLEIDLVFLRLVSLPKGQKLLARYIQHLQPGDELICVVSMAILRHLRFVFGFIRTDPRTAESTANLARVIASSVSGMDLDALSACLAAVVCSSEQPPFLPIGSLAGDGASLILKAVLQRATDLLTDPRASGTCNMANREIWQGSFDEFFCLLAAYCTNKYDSVMQTLVMPYTPGTAFLGSVAASAISKEMPVDLLRASLPHTSDQQRKVLLDFAKRSMHVAKLDD